MFSFMLLFTASTEAYNQCKMTDYSNPLRGIVPKAVHKDDVDDTALVELIEKLEGEVAFDAYVKALMSTPEVAARITELENCLQRLANAVWASGMIDKGSGLRAATEEAAIVLKNRLEVADVASRIKKRVSARLEPFQDDLQLNKSSRPKAPDSNG
jgi:Ni,Fe-hydrogenase III large subunit